MDEIRGKYKIAKSIVSFKFAQVEEKKNLYFNFCLGFWKVYAGALVQEATGAFEFLVPRMDFRLPNSPCRTSDSLGRYVRTKVA